MNAISLMQVIIFVGNSITVAFDTHGSAGRGRETFCPKSRLETLILLLRQAKCSSVSLIYESEDSPTVHDIMQLFDQKLIIPVSLFDVSKLNDFEIHKILHSIYFRGMSKIHIILLLNRNTSTVLKRASEFDELSNKSSDYVTNSRWIFLQTKNDILNYTSKLKNVILLSCFTDFVQRIENDRNIRIDCVENNIMEIATGKLKCSIDDLYPNIKYKLNGRELKIGTIMDKYFGHIVLELTTTLSQALNFTYKFVEPSDRRFGSLVDGQWEGLVGLLVRQEVDIVIAELTVTKERMGVIDFILPGFLSHGIGILYHQDVELESDWVKIFRPFHYYVYLCMFGTLVFVGFLLFFLNKDELQSMSSRRQFLNSVVAFVKILIHLVGFLSIRGTGMIPRTVSARVLLTTFWMFCVVITAVYIGNFTAKITESRAKKPFDSPEDLTRLPDWKWGLNDIGLTMELLKSSKVKTFQDLWSGILRFNSTDPLILEGNREVHFRRLLNPEEKYAFLIFDARFYLLNRKDCALGTIETDVISNLNLAIAVSKNSCLKLPMETVMGRLADNGFLDNLNNLRYKDNRPSSCKADDKNRTVYFDDVKGALLIVFIGLIFSVFVLFAEILANLFVFNCSKLK